MQLREQLKQLEQQAERMGLADARIAITVQPPHKPLPPCAGRIEVEAQAGLGPVLMSDNRLSGNREGGGGGLAYYAIVFVLEIVFGLLASVITMGFSRWREFRADAGGARLAGREKMIAALQRLAQNHGQSSLPSQIAAFGISGGLKSGIGALMIVAMSSWLNAAALAGSAAAFAPAPVAKTSSAIRAFEDELGVQPPLGFFDPFGMLSGDVTQERFDRLRYVEIKHGRIAQLAFLGQIVTRAGLHLPGDIDYSGHAFDSYPNGVAALIGPNSIPFEGQGQIIAFIGLLEVSFMRDVPGTGNEHVGDFRNGYIDFGWDLVWGGP